MLDQRHPWGAIGTVVSQGPSHVSCPTRAQPFNPTPPTRPVDQMPLGFGGSVCATRPNVNKLESSEEGHSTGRPTTATPPVNVRTYIYDTRDAIQSIPLSMRWPFTRASGSSSFLRIPFPRKLLNSSGGTITWQVRIFFFPWTVSPWMFFAHFLFILTWWSGFRLASCFCPIISSSAMICPASLIAPGPSSLNHQLVTNDSFTEKQCHFHQQGKGSLWSLTPSKYWEEEAGLGVINRTEGINLQYEYWGWSISRKNITKIDKSISPRKKKVSYILYEGRVSYKAKKIDLSQQKLM